MITNIVIKGDLCYLMFFLEKKEIILFVKDFIVPHICDFYKNISDTNSNSTYYYILTLYTGLVTLIINVPIKNTKFSQLVSVDPSIVNPLWVNWFF